MFAFINEFYRPASMLENFGTQYVLQIPSSSGDPILVGTVFCYFISLLTGYLLWFVAGKLFRNFKADSLTEVENADKHSNCSNFSNC